MIEKKFLRIDQRPDQVLEVVIGGSAGFVEIPEGGLEFGRTWFAGEGGEVEFADAVFGRASVFRELIGTAGRAGEFGFDVGSVDQMQALREA